MDEDRFGGTLKQAAGKVQGTAGDLLGDSKMQAEGAAREVAGRAQDAYGQVKDAARGAAEQVGRGVEQQPVVALLIAGVIGYALGLMTSRR